MNETHETIDILDPYSGEKTGESILRFEAHRAGIWHGVIHVWFINAIDEPSLYVQQRSMLKDVSPGLLDVTVGGHYKVGETAEDGFREIHEELNLDVPVNELLYVGKRWSLYKERENKINQIVDTFIHFTSVPIQRIKFQEEVDKLFSIPIKEIFKILEDSTYSYWAKGMKRQGSLYLPCEMEVGQVHFIPYPDNYIYKISMLAMDMIKGKKRAFI